MSKKKSYKVVGALDTETTSVGKRQAFVCLYQVRTWKSLKGKGTTKLYSTPEEVVEALPRATEKYVPIVAAYNLAFDLTSLIPVLEARGYTLEAFGPASSPMYVEVLEGGEPVLRFWEVSRLCPQGLDVMGDLAGLPKLSGTWEYEKYREPGCELTEEEKAYAVRDTEVIQEYLKYLLSTHPFLKEKELGVRVLTQTSLVRLYGERKLSRKVISGFMAKAAEEEPPTEEVYRLRKACFRAGLTFTGAKCAGKVQEEVLSVDATSMHHSFILGRMVPRGFRDVPQELLQRAFEGVVHKSVQEVLAHYEKPFTTAFHSKVLFKGLRVREGSVFEAQGIAPLARATFAERVEYRWEDGDSSEAAENRNRALGYHAQGKGMKWSFGKLVKAEECTVYLSELEAWVVAQAYQWEEATVLEGELSTTWCLPPEYLLKLDAELYGAKKAMKEVLAGGEGTGVPEAIKNAPREVQKGYYLHTSKAMYNAIFGMCAMDAHKHQVEWKKVPHPKSWYTVGMRIAGGSRVHLVLALMLLQEAYPTMKVVGGDTDSIKMCGIEETELQKALAPLHEAISKAIKKVLGMAGMESEWAMGIGTFESEGTAALEVELFNKNRLAWYPERGFELTAAGIPTPMGKPCLLTALEALARKYGVRKVMEKVYGPSLEVHESLSCFNFPVRPEGTTVEGFPAATALVPIPRVLGDLYSAEMQSVREGLPKEYEPRTIELTKSGMVQVYESFTGEVLYSAPFKY